MRIAIAPRIERLRLDVLLVERGLARSRRDAQALILSGRVRAGGLRREKPGALVRLDAAVTVEPPPRGYVSRGGEKLAGALDAFGIDVAGLSALDVGASTGGFTDCLLRRGAARVVAVDVGHGQLDWTLRRDPRVSLLEGVNARRLEARLLPPGSCPFDLATVDVSFISLRLVLPPLPPLLRAEGRVLALVKPQFEVGRGKVGRGGIVRDPALRRDALTAVAAAARSAGLSVAGMAPSPLRGAEGNIEYFLHLRPGPGGLGPREIEDHAHEITSRESD